MKVKVSAKVGIVSVPFPLKDPEVCKGLIDGECPLIQGDVATYQLLVPVKKVYPKVSYEI